MKLSLLAIVLSLTSLLCAQSPDPFAPPAGSVPATLQVQDASGKPVPGAEVDLQRDNTFMGSGTDAQGSARLNVVPGATYSLSIQAPGYKTFTRQWTAGQSSAPFRIQTDPNQPAQSAADSGVPQSQGTSNGSTLTSDQAGSDSSSAETPDTSQTGPPSVWQTVRETLAAIVYNLLPFAVFLGLREITVRTVHLLMMRRTTPNADATADPQPVAENSQRSAASPAFLEMNTLDGILLDGTAEARLERAEETGRRKLAIFLRSLVVQAITLIAVVGGLGLWIERTHQEVPAILLSGAGAQLVLDLLFAFYAWSTHLQRLRIVELLAILSPVAGLILTVAGLRMHLPFVIVLPVTFQVAYLVFRWWQLRRTAAADGNQKILILRVFGSDKNAAFTFGGLMNGWRFIGSYLTIVDPAYIRFRFTVFSKGGASQSLGALLTLGTLTAVMDLAARFLPVFAPGLVPAAWSGLPPEVLRERIHSVALVLLAVVAVGPWVLYVWRRFLKSPEQAVKQVDRIRDARLSIEMDYAGSALFCYDDVWKPAVREMLVNADVVLMDLRGFCKERLGCAYEIGELIDRYPVGRVLFLIDGNTPRELFYTLFRERWATMHPDSPNQLEGQPLVQVYETADRDQRDIRHIAALLCATLSGSPERITAWVEPARTLLAQAS